MAPFCRISSGLLAATILASCATPPGKQETGAAAGSVAGEGAESQIGGSSGRTAAIITGAAAGRGAGAKYRRYLDEQDNRNLTQATAKALDTDTMQVYTSSAGAEVAISTRSIPSHAEAVRMQLMVSPEVNTNYPLRADKRIVYAMTDMDLRAAPALTSKTTRLFRHGEMATVVAYVPHSQYRLVSIDGVAIGYARQVYLAPSRQEVPPARYRSADKASGYAPKKRGAMRPKRLTVMAECKLVRRVIRLPGGAADTENATFCKEPPSAWKQMG